MARERQERYDDGWQARPRQADSGRRGGLRGGPLVTPVRLVVVVALIGTLAYLVFAITVRDPSQIPMLASGAAVLGIVFTALAVSGAVSTYRAGADGRGGRAFAFAILGGIAAMIAAGCFAGAVVLALVSQGT